MAGSTISNQVTISVTLGSGVYSSPLTITPTGSINAPDSPASSSSVPSPGAAGVLSTIAGQSVLNQGIIVGGLGPRSLVDFASLAGNGGFGVDISGGNLVNAGTIAGGQGGPAASHFEAYGGAGGGGVSLGAGSSMVNMGSVGGGAGSSGYNRQGLMLFFGGGSGADVTNSALTNDARIEGGLGGEGGIGVRLVSSLLTNNGMIAGGTARGNFDINNGLGVYAEDSTLINNGTIDGAADSYGFAAVEVTNSTLINNGLIVGGSGMYAGGNGANVTSSAFANNGTITGGDAGTDNTAAGIGVLFKSGGTLTDAGFISGGSSSAFGTIADAVNFGTGTSRLILQQGAAFSGNVVTHGASTLQLASAAATGSITGIGSSFSGFGAISVDPNATWVVHGSVAGSGTFSLGAGSDLIFDGAVAATSPVDFTASTGTLGLADPADFAATVFRFHPGDAIDFTSITSTGSIAAGVNASNDLTLTSSGTLLAEIKLNPAQGFPGFFFHAASDGGTGTVVTDSTAPICFLPGTMIATPSGEVAIERLGVGDSVVTASGAVRPIVWIGTGRVLATRNRRSAATPVIVRKGALADNVPHRDLRVTKAHALGVDGVLIPVEFLVNHRSILWDDMAREVVLYHIELETHDVLLADGAPAESYRDDGNRWLFRNASSGWHLPPKPPCAPVLTGGPLVDAIWRGLLDRAGPRPGLLTTDDPDLHLLVDGEPLRGLAEPGGVYLFNLPRRPASTRIISHAGSPAELGITRDPRQLGVAVRRVAVRQRARFRVMQASDQRLTGGFHGFEADHDFRWTDGNAVLPAPLFDGFDGPMELMLQIGATSSYPLTAERAALAANL